ncbi:P-loop containing nucleoside triphosphate hydrolase protein, partial [Mycena latifolia]
MPPPSKVVGIRLQDIMTCLTSGIKLLKDLHDAFGSPFILAIANTTSSLIVVVQNVKRNKNECIELMENIHGLIYAVVDLHLKSETPGSLPPTILYRLGKSTETLHKIHAFIEAQQDRSIIKHLFRQNETHTLLKECREGIQEVLSNFKIDATNLGGVIAIQQKLQNMHRELLELISSLSDGTMSERSSLIDPKVNVSYSSSTSFSMLPAQPKIFHGRNLELYEILKALHQDAARVAILGAGGMGKTSLARAALHHPTIVTKYDCRFFVPCDSVTSDIELATLIGAHLGLKPQKDLKKPIIQYFSRSTPCLLILDNLETPWEPRESRGEIEEFLSLLTDVPHLALLITMRGAERPGKVQWTHPFLPPLRPLSNEAARNIFIDIADEFHDSNDIDKILALTNNMPLAVDLIAHLVDHEGCESVLTRWETEKTSVLSEGYDRRSNLDASIAISLSSPRITSLSGARDLLSLLSILPDGISDVELLQASLPIQDPLACKAALLSTSLAYNDDRKRLKALVPIREHIQKFSPPSIFLIQPLQKHFSLLLDLYHSRSQQMAGTVNQITLNLGNLHHILLQGFYPDNPGIQDTIRCTVSLNHFSRETGRGRTILMN